MQAQVMMVPAGGSWMAYVDNHGRPCWRNTATNEWTYSNPGFAPGLPPQQQQMIFGYPGGVYGWPTAMAPAATVPPPGSYFYGPGGTPHQQQVMYMQPMMQHPQHPQQQVMMMMPEYPQQPQQYQMMMFPESAAAVGAATAAPQEVPHGDMMPDPNGPDAAAWFSGPGPAYMPYPSSHEDKGEFPVSFEAADMMPEWLGDAAEVAFAGVAAGKAAGSANGLAGIYGKAKKMGVEKEKEKEKEEPQRKNKKEEEEEDEPGDESDDNDNGSKSKSLGEEEEDKDPTAPPTVTDDDASGGGGGDGARSSRSSSRSTVVAAAASDFDDDDDDGSGADVEKEVVTASAAAAAAAAGIAAAVAAARSSPEANGANSIPKPPGDAAGGGGEGEGATQAVARGAGGGAWVPYIDADGCKRWRSTVTGKRLDENP